MGAPLSNTRVDVHVDVDVDVDACASFSPVCVPTSPSRCRATEGRKFRPHDSTPTRLDSTYPCPSSAILKNGCTPAVLAMVQDRDDFGGGVQELLEVHVAPFFRRELF